jgi:hypothetical protein
MQDATAGSHGPTTVGYSLQEAATLLGIGINTLRRRIAAGQVHAEQVERPQGYIWRVYLDGRHPTADPTSQPANQEATGSLPHPPTVAPAEAMVSLIQTTISTVLGPLVAELAASRQTIERQGEQIGELRATVARLEARNGTLEAPTAAQASDLTMQPSPPWWRSWSVWGPAAIGVLLVVVLAGALLVGR